jgi:hypothetical protein
MTAISSLNPFVFGNDSNNDKRESGDEYAIVRHSGVAAPEVDRDDADVLEVTVRWGRTVLGVAHVAQGESLKIGEDDGGKIMLPESFLGATSYTLIASGNVMVPQHALGIEGKGAQSVSKDQKLRFTLGADSDRAITIQVARVAAPRKLISKRNLKRGIFAIAVASLAAHAGVVTALAFSPGASLDEDNAPLDKATSAYMISTYKNADVREMPKQEEETTASTKGNAGGDDGQAHQGPGGMMGTQGAPANGGAYTVKGPPETKEEHLAKLHALINSGDYGALGAMKSVFGVANGPVDLASAFDDSIGHEAQNFDGNLMGDHPGNSFGFNGLGMTGTGWGGDGNGTGIGLGSVGGFGHGPGVGGFLWGNCAGDMCGTTIGTTIANKKHPTKGVTMIDTNTGVTGGYPREIVQRIVRANFPRLRACYDTGLKMDPGLRGNVTTRFIIDQTGAVETASLASSTIGSPAVASCVVGVFNTMSFPAPETGKALVSYPIDFDHNDE